MVQRPEGFDFLGFHVQMRGQTLLITPQQQKVQALLQEIRAWLKTHATVTAAVVIHHLNPLIRGWAMYYRHVVSQHTFQHVDDHIWRALWRWVKRRHPKKPKRWLYRRYFEVGKYGATSYTESRDRRGVLVYGGRAVHHRTDCAVQGRRPRARARGPAGEQHVSV